MSDNVPLPPLDADALQSLRAMFREVGSAARGGVPMVEVLTLPARLAGGLAVTVDFSTTPNLGHPLVVLRVPPEPTLANSPLNPRLAKLSAREREIAELVARGLSNKQIAARESITLATVKAHVHHILVKTNLPNRAAIAAAVVQHAE